MLKTSDKPIDYVPVALPEPAAAIEVSEYVPYQGLEPFVDRILSLKVPNDIRGTLTVMLVELDNGLQAFERGDVAQAVRSHKAMLDYSKQAFKQAGALPQARQAEVQKIFIDITSATRGVKNDDGSEKSWGKTLAAIVEEYKRAQKAEQNLALQPDGLPAAFFSSPRRQQRTLVNNDYFSRDFTASAEIKVGSPTAWTRNEYRNLGIVLEQMSTPGQPARVDAMVALSQLRRMNASETEYLKNSRNGARNEGTQNKTYKESRKRLQELSAKLLKNPSVRAADKTGLARWLKPVTAYAPRFERISQGPSLIAKAFFAAAGYIAEQVKKVKPAATPKPL